MLNGALTAIYNGSTNEVVLEAIQKNTAFGLSASSSGLAQSLRFQGASTVQIVCSATMDWTPSFSGLLLFGLGLLAVMVKGPVGTN